MLFHWKDYCMKRIDIQKETVNTGVVAQEWRSRLMAAAMPERISVLSRFFKTGPGEYGEGDVFIGLYVPDNRRISQERVSGGNRRYAR